MVPINVRMFKKSRRKNITGPFCSNTLVLCTFGKGAEGAPSTDRKHLNRRASPTGAATTEITTSTKDENLNLLPVYAGRH